MLLTCRGGARRIRNAFRREPYFVLSRETMKTILLRSMTALLLVLTSAGLLLAQGPPGQQGKQAQGEGRASQAGADTLPKEEWSATKHMLRMGGQDIPYQAGAGTTLLKN